MKFTKYAKLAAKIRSMTVSEGGRRLAFSNCETSKSKAIGKSTYRYIINCKKS